MNYPLVRANCSKCIEPEPDLSSSLLSELVQPYRTISRQEFGENIFFRYSVDYDQWDTTADQNVGFRYRNVEKMNYFPDWPSCPDRNQSLCVSPQAVNCSLQANFCDDCCQGSYVNGTYLIPPGLYPLVCYPGRLEPSPFSVMYSPPHFVYSPKEVPDSVYGLSPNLDQHRPILYVHEPVSGSKLKKMNDILVLGDGGGGHSPADGQYADFSQRGRLVSLYFSNVCSIEPA